MRSTCAINAPFTMGLWGKCGGAADAHRRLLATSRGETMASAQPCGYDDQPRGRPRHARRHRSRCSRCNIGDGSKRKIKLRNLIWTIPDTGLFGALHLRTKWRDHDMRIRPKDRANWKRWFAWHPILIDNVIVWLEIVERKRDPDIFDWVYSYRTLDRNNRRRELRARHTPVRQRFRSLWRA
jgi:hypothetical protein